jgi:hypothetical protein
MPRIPKKKGRKQRRAAIVSTRLPNPAGGVRKLFTLDASSPTFDEDLTYVFTRNIADARRENQALFGSPDGLRRAVVKAARSGPPNGIRKK